MREWFVWVGTNWHQTGFDQQLQTNWWYEVTFTAGLHDNQVFYSGFKAGSAGNLTSFTSNHTYNAPGNSTPAAIVPAMQIDDNTHDTTTAGTQKNCYMAEWHIDWMYERLP
ncbi:MAG TPA: hypothetical protein VNV43_14680 [Candidatus Acidoferrales bacterium]|nr:hypothetical protein [Candidatus Acidoferrales bacterium]